MKETLYEIIDHIVENLFKYFVIIFIITFALALPTIINNYNERQEEIKLSNTPIYTGTLKDVSFNYFFINEITTLIFEDGRIERPSNLKIDIIIGQNYTIIYNNITERQHIILGEP